MVGARLWLFASMVASFGVAHGNDASSPDPFGPVIPPAPCPTRAAARGWIRGTVTSLDQPTSGCTPVAGITAPAGCVIGAFDPSCNRTSQNVTVSIDGAPQTVSRPTIGDWQVCGLSPGKHVLTVCSSRGDFGCAADTSTVVQIVAVEPQISLAWTEAGNEPHAYVCEPPRSPAPGCSRCDATGDPEHAALLFAVVAFALGRRR